LPLALAGGLDLSKRKALAEEKKIIFPIGFSLICAKAKGMIIFYFSFG